MLTHCPHCQTTFRVTTEQLKVRHGQVRCGECREVFDALDSLVDEANVAVRPAAPPAVDLLLEPHTEETAQETIEETRFWRGGGRAEEAVTPVIDLELETPEPPADLQPLVEEGADLATAVLPEESFMPKTAEDVPEALAEEVAGAAATTAVPEQAVAPEAEPALPEAWEAVPASVRPPRRWPWAVGSTALFLLLLGQALYFFRGPLAILAPEMRPLLVAGCDLFGCTLPRSRKPELVSIEASDLTPESGQLILSATIKNRAPFEQEYPSLELTLTDTQDLALISKVLTPNDYLPADRAPASGFPARGEVALKLRFEADDVPAVGYRLYLFYP